MVLELVASVALGLGVGGIVLVLRFLSRGRIPGYAVPIAAGLGMIFFSLWSEYSWFSRIRADLPERVVILKTFGERLAYKPWSYLYPRIDRFSALDPASTRTHPDLPDLRMVQILLVAHRQPTLTLSGLVDCRGRRFAEIDAQVALDAQGAPLDADWNPLESDDPLLPAACGG